jgi:uncharacterized protein (TIGR02246 family)
MLTGKHVPVCLVLAAGAVLGCAACERLGFAQRALGQAEGPTDIIAFTVRLPGDAVLLIDDYQTQLRGDVRTFQTPPLPIGGQYTYTLKATSDGKEVTRTIRLSHGADNTFDLRAEFRPAGTDRPEAKATTGTGQRNPLSASTVRAADATNNPADEKALHDRAAAFLAAFNKGDAQALAGFWTPDGDYTDDLGHQYQGRKAIEESFQKLFSAARWAELRVHRGSYRLVRPDLAIGDGVYEVVPPDGGPPTSARYTAVHVKQDGQWFLESVHEAVATPPSNSAKLEELSWLIGDWADEAERGAVARASFSWDENQNFIVSTFVTTLKDVPVGGATQWIGWDAAEKQVRSWSFDSSGGFSEGVWTRDGDRLVCKTITTMRDGKKVSATNIVTRIDADHLTWQSVQRSVDGKSLPDAEVVKMKRVPPE